MTTHDPVLLAHVYDFDHNDTSDSILMEFNEVTQRWFATVLLTDDAGKVIVRTPPKGLKLQTTIICVDASMDLDTVYIEGDLDRNGKPDGIRMEPKPSGEGKGDWRAAYFICEGAPKDIWKATNPDEPCLDRAGYILSDGTALKAAAKMTHGDVVDFLAEAH
jgi:hypothetical protein